MMTKKNLGQYSTGNKKVDREARLLKKYLQDAFLSWRLCILDVHDQNWLLCSAPQQLRKNFFQKCIPTCVIESYDTTQATLTQETCLGIR